MTDLVQQGTSEKVGMAVEQLSSFVTGFVGEFQAFVSLSILRCLNFKILNVSFSGLRALLAPSSCAYLHLAMHRHHWHCDDNPDVQMDPGFPRLYR